MLNQFSRTELLFGKEAMDILENSRVAVFGVGGVGGYTVEALVRSGVGAIDVIDDDKVCLTNLNRQIIATRKTIGQYKTDVCKERIHDINPNCEVTVHKCFFLPETKDQFDFSKYDYVVDAIDTVAPKCYLIYHALQRGIKIVSSMGAGAKRDITQVRFADLWETYHCGLSKAVRKRLQKMGMKRKLPVVFSTEQADQDAVILVDDEKNKKSTAGTVSYMPAVFGCYLAEYVIRRI